MSYSEPKKPVRRSLFLQTGDKGHPQKTISAYSQQQEVDEEPNIVEIGWDLAELDERELRPSSEEEKRRNGEHRNGGTACVTSSDGGGTEGSAATKVELPRQPSEKRVSMLVVAVAVSFVSVSLSRVSKLKVKVSAMLENQSKKSYTPKCRIYDAYLRISSSCLSCRLEEGRESLQTRDRRRKRDDLSVES